MSTRPHPCPHDDPRPSSSPLALSMAFALVAGGTILSMPVRAQIALHTFTDMAPGDEFARSVSCAGDVDGDGFDDVIVGADQCCFPTGPGYAQVLSGFDGSTIHLFNGDSTSDRFGWSVSGAGFVDADAIPDLIVGAPLDDNNGFSSGMARVFSGADGSILHSFNGSGGVGLATELGFSVSDAGNVNGDNSGDVLVGAPFDDASGIDSGSAFVFSGIDGSVLYQFMGDAIGDELGYSVSGAGDVNQDGVPDILVGAPQGVFQAGYVRVFSGADGSTLFTFVGDSAGDLLGFSVSDAGDVNNDGFYDVIAGAPGDDDTGTGAGSARIFSGADGSTLYTFFGNGSFDAFGSSVSGAGDMDGDGFDDVIVPWISAMSAKGYARVYSGQDGSVVTTFSGDSSFDGFGSSVSDTGDLDNNGIPDVIVGARVFAGDSYARTFGFCVAVFANYGSGLAGSSGWTPQIGGEGACPTPGGSFSIKITYGLGGASGVLFLGIQPLSLPALGGTILVNPVIQIPQTLGGGVPGEGSASLPVAIPNNPALLGVDLYWQGLFLDSGAVAGVSMTNGLQTEIG